MESNCYFCYCLFDKKLGSYSFFALLPDDVQFKARCEIFVRNLDKKKDYIYHHLDEYAMYCCGSFDPTKGEFISLDEKNRFMCELLDFKGCLMD